MLALTRIALLMTGVSVSLALTGCGHSMSGGASSGVWGGDKTNGVPGIDSGGLSVGKYVVDGHETNFAVWSDFSEGIGIGGGTHKSGWLVEGTFGCHSDREHPAPFKCTSPDGVTATMTIAGVDYDVADGPLFLVSTQVDTPQVMQLQFDIHTLPEDLASCSQIAEANEQIADFFRQAAEKDSTESDKSPAKPDETEAKR